MDSRKQAQMKVSGADSLADEVMDSPRASESVARVLAYCSPYLFWGSVALLSIGMLLA